MARRQTLLQLTFTAPMECKPVQSLPEGPNWRYELKFDGYRAQALRDGDGMRLMSRNGKNLANRFPAVTAALTSALPIGSSVDGELVAFDSENKPSFNALQNASSHTHVVFYAFDLIFHAGKNVSSKPLAARRDLLMSVLRVSELVDLSTQFEADASFIGSVREVGGEGVIAKRLDSFYEAGKRTGAWRKMRINLAQEFVVGGFTKRADPFDAVLLGFYKTPPAPAHLPPSRRQYVVPAPPQLMYCASVRAGFVPATRRELFRRLKPLITSDEDGTRCR